MDKRLDTWDIMRDWDLVLPPSRPSAYQLNLLKQVCADISRQAPIVVLGSTPEYRDIFCECGFTNITVIDRNPKFFRAMSELRVYDNKERFLEGDWLDILPQHQLEFALIVSDLTSGNIPYEDRLFFYNALSGALACGGVFFDKVLTHPGSLLSVTSLIEKYMRLPVNIATINNFSCEMLFCSELLDIAGIVDSTAFYEHLDGVIQNPRVRRFVSDAKLITPTGCTWWYGRRWSELSRDYCPSLAQVSCWDEEPTSPYAGRLKYFCCKKETLE